MIKVPPRTMKIIKILIFTMAIIDSMYPKYLVPSLFIPTVIINVLKAKMVDEILGIQYFKKYS